MAAQIPEEKRSQNIKIKGRTQRENKEISFYNLAQIIEARLLDIVENVMEEIKESGYADKLGSGIVLTGGGAYLKDIDTLFRERTKYDVRTGSAYPELVNDRSLPAADDMHLSSAIGLLLLGLQESRIAADAEPLRKREKTEEQTDTATDRQIPTDEGQRPAPDGEGLDIRNKQRTIPPNVRRMAAIRPALRTTAKARTKRDLSEVSADSSRKSSRSSMTTKYKPHQAMTDENEVIVGIKAAEKESLHHHGTGSRRCGRQRREPHVRPGYHGRHLHGLQYRPAGPQCQPRSHQGSGSAKGSAQATTPTRDGRPR